MTEFYLKPIGRFHGNLKHKSSAPRQGFLSQQKGFIRFQKGFDSKLALKGLEKMSHVWVIFSFHLNQESSKPLVRPPRNPDIQVGVWATRSPYRPNNLGLTLARIEKIQNGELHLSEVDLLDGTPVFDIKPYVTESDRPQKPKLGWIDEVEKWKYRLSKKALKQAQYLFENGVSEIFDVIESQFGTPPLHPKRKRVREFEDHYELAYRTWRFRFKADLEKHRSQILEIKSGYTPQEIQDSSDPYEDKKIHRHFLEAFKV